MLRILSLLLVMASTVANATIVSRLKLDHPALGTSGGVALHTQVESLYTKIGDNIDSRYFTHSAVANSTTVEEDHNFGVAFDELTVLIYTGSHPNLTRVPDPVASGWTIAATVGFEKTKIDVTTPASGGPHTFAVVIIQGSAVEVLDDLDDVDVTTTPPEDGQALVYDSVNSEWVPGASGDSSLKCQAVSDPNLTLKSGYLILDSGMELQVASDLTVNLDTVLGTNPANATAYYLYVDLDALPAATILSNGRQVRVVSTAAHFSLQTSLPDSVLSTRYVPLCVIKSATTGTVWSGAGSAFATLATRRHGRPVVNVSPTVYELSKQAVGAVGSSGQISAGHILDSNSFGFTFADDIAFYNLTSTTDNSGATSCSSGSAACTLTNNGTATFGGTGILGSATTLSLSGTNQFLSSTDSFFDPAGVFLIAFWAKSASATSQAMVYGWTSLSDRNYAIDFQGNIACVDYAVHTDAEAASAAASFLRFCPPSTTVGGWHHYAMGWDGTYVKYYYDGVLVHQFAQGSVNEVASGQRFALGTDYTDANDFNGQFDELVFMRHSFTDSDVRKLYASRIDHNKAVLPENQAFYATFYNSSESIVNEFNKDWIVSQNSNSVYTDFGLGATDKVSIRLQNQSFSTTSVPISSYSSGLVSSAPSFPITHGLGCRPKDYYVLHEGASISGDYDKRYDLCSVDDTTITCDLTSLTIDGTHRVEVVASCAPIAVSVPFASASEAGIVSTGTQTIAGAKTFTGALTTNAGISNTTGGLTSSGASTFTGGIFRSSRADSTPSGTAASTNDDMVLGSTDTTNTGMTIFSGTSGFGIINFGDSGSNNAGAIAYDHSGNQFRFRANDTADVLMISSTQAELSVKTDGPSSIGNVYSETDNHTATLSNQTNLDTTETCTVSSYLRVGKVIQYSFHCLVNPTAANWDFEMTVGFGSLQGTGAASECNGGVGGNDFGVCGVRSATSSTVEVVCYDVNGAANPPQQRLYGTFQCDVTN